MSITVGNAGKLFSMGVVSTTPGEEEQPNLPFLFSNRECSRWDVEEENGVTESWAFRGDGEDRVEMKKEVLGFEP